MADALISVITIILDARYADDAKTNEAVETLKQQGMRVENVDYGDSVVHGTIEQSRVHALQKLDCVDYVRTTFTYYADFPPGDPRDTDGAGR
jgi:hypothetical protein